jgi:hypothetical protein
MLTESSRTARLVSDDYSNLPVKYVKLTYYQRFLLLFNGGFFFI